MLRTASLARNVAAAASAAAPRTAVSAPVVRASVPRRSIWQGYRETRYPKEAEPALREVSRQFSPESKLPRPVYYDNEKVASFESTFAMLLVGSIAAIAYGIMHESHDE